MARREGGPPTPVSDQIFERLQALLDKQDAQVSGTYAFPPTLPEVTLDDEVGQYDEGPIPRVGRPNPPPVTAGERPSYYRLYRVEDNLQMVELSGFGDPAYFSYDPPPGHVPQGLLQWYVKHPGDSGFAPFGDTFRYRVETNSFWERNA